MSLTIETQNLKKKFTMNVKGKKETFEAVRGVSLNVQRGEVFGFLGPNGAGKTTTMRMLTTLLPVDEGSAYIVGYDVKHQPQEVRKRIGYVSQLGGGDPNASGRENLLLQGLLYGMSKEETINRTNELVEIFDLKKVIDRKVKTYSGGQKRRLEISLGIIHQPEVLFLDEPTSGLDPQNRANLWHQIKTLRDMGTTIFLTTHYLDEADILSDRLVIVDHGMIVAEGTPQGLKKQVAGDVIEIKLKQFSPETDQLKKELNVQPYIREVHWEKQHLRLYVDDSATCLPNIVDWLKIYKMDVDSLSLSQPSLDDVFLRQTGRSLRDSGVSKEEKQ
ncbi:Daunorubicin/doxorubicin resistance ATP-binding protein DrrA [Paenibacillus sp. CECT 9249]|uniref:ATP-binding cassette domain-containing protein n=1 Tax=Paenibacillus sp. CECT 9249 TaxID=2845385 RepID=UPI001E47D56C|nr:ATP-binding cassette domain-containing protein [Paenibacillus sp. CECT 9249]CAH0122356.1 Daunorubicin/doxorubicin resistance ATP-binding protein DrrA [Paenibacillus sp. CECT 9249]